VPEGSFRGPDPPEAAIGTDGNEGHGLNPSGPTNAGSGEKVGGFYAGQSAKTTITVDAATRLDEREEVSRRDAQKTLTTEAQRAQRRKDREEMQGEPIRNSI
jgi:hypothetical protein